MKYKFRDKVKVVSGFYEGLIGFCWEHKDGYGVRHFDYYKLDSLTADVWFHEHELEKIPE